MTQAEALEAHFGRYRVVVRGMDVRGYYQREGAEREVAWHRERHGPTIASVRDGAGPLTDGRRSE